MNGESFEYDEDIEAGDEAFEASDEGDEASDESEGDEASDESWEASDEADTEADEASDEAFEASDEADEAADEASDEADEAADEAMTASARLRATRDQNRRAAWARRIAAGQRAEAQRAALARRNITGQIRSVRAGGPPRVASVGSLRGAGVVTAILPNGRRSQMRIIPTMAAVGEVNRLRSVMLLNERRQATASAKNSRAIAALATAQAAAVKKLSEEQVKSDNALSKRIVEGDNRLDKRITKELSGGSGVLDKHGKRMMRLLKRQRQRSIMNSVLLATSAPLFAAYGDRKLFSWKNGILTGSLLFWLVGDELIDSFAGKSKAMRSVADIWSWGAFAGNGLTDYLVFRNRQNERFIGGVATAPTTGAAFKLDLTTEIGSNDFEQFKKDGHAVVATVISTTTTDLAVEKAEVGTDGFLKITLSGTPAAGTTVAWVIDTRATTAVAAVAA